MKHWWLPIVGLVLMLVSCTPSRPSGVLSHSRMVALLVDYHLAQGMAESGDKEVERRYEYVQAALHKHGVSEEQFDRSMIYYCEQTQRLAEIYREVNTRIEAAAAISGADTEKHKPRYAQLGAVGDTANIWHRQKMVILKPSAGQNIFSFVLEADSNFRAGDSFEWHFQSLFVTKGVRGEASALLIVRYDNDSVAANTQYVAGEDEHTVRVRPRQKHDTLHIRQVEGHIYLPIDKKKENVYRMMTISQMYLLRCHKPQAKPANTAPTDSTQTQPADSVAVQRQAVQPQRLSPAQLREAQPREHRIEVQKEKPVNPRLKPNRNINSPLGTKSNK